MLLSALVPGCIILVGIEKHWNIYKKILSKSEKAILKYPDFKSPKDVAELKLDVCVRIAQSYESGQEYVKAVEYFNMYLAGKKRGIPSEYTKKQVQGYLRDCKAEIAKQGMRLVRSGCKKMRVEA